MDHQGWRWLVGLMAPQLLGCGQVPTATTSSDPAERRQSAQNGHPFRNDDGANSVARDVSANADAVPSEPEITTSSGWEAVRCAGAGTRRVTMAGNLDAESFDIASQYGPFDTDNPAAHANFGATVSGFDDQGRLQSVTVYFDRRGLDWDYHVIMDGTSLVIGEGQLRFDEQGRHLATDVQQELRLLTATGPGHVVELDFTEMTSTVAPSSLSRLAYDGRQATWGSSCAGTEPMLEEPPVTGPACAATATTRIALGANLAASAAIAGAPRDALVPDSELTALLVANDESGALIDFALHLRKASAESWDYQVLFAGDASGKEVANGALRFNPNGSLRSVNTTQPLRFPNVGQRPGAPIELDFGKGTDDGGTGVDGVTALAGASAELWQHVEGTTLDCLPRSAAPMAPTPHSLRCAGERTTAIGLYFNLDPSTPLAGSYQATASVYDAVLEPHPVVLVFQRVGELHWQCHIIAANTEAGVVNLRFNGNGSLSSIEKVPSLRLPLPDGSVGPPIDLALDQSWAVTSFAGPSDGWLQPNGTAPSTANCVE